MDYIVESNNKVALRLAIALIKIKKRKERVDEWIYNSKLIYYILHAL